jgi:hypothetical protein
LQAHRVKHLGRMLNEIEEMRRRLAREFADYVVALEDLCHVLLDPFQCLLNLIEGVVNDVSDRVIEVVCGGSLECLGMHTSPSAR